MKYSTTYQAYISDKLINTFITNALLYLMIAFWNCSFIATSMPKSDEEDQEYIFTQSTDVLQVW